MVRKKEHHEDEADEKWLLPYSDMLTLLLALFIVMFAMSKIDNEKFMQMSGDFNVIFQGGSGFMDGGGSGSPQIVTPNGAISNSQLEDDKMNEIKENLEAEVEEAGYSDQIKVVLNREGLEVSIQDIVLFKSGDAKVVDEVSPLLVKISDMLHDLDNNIKIVGHSDNVPISNDKFRSNWDLSAMRAINVMNFMVEKGGLPPDKFSIQAYGEYMPKYDNSTEEGRTKNRRVEIFIGRKYPLDNKNTQNK